MPLSLQKADFHVQATLPVALTFIFVMMQVLPWSWDFMRALLAPLPLACLTYWVANKPELFGKRWSFFIGLAQDVLMGTPLGLAAFSYLGVDFFLRSQRPHFLQQSFTNLWLIFSIALLGVNALQWGVVSMNVHEWASPLLWGIRLLIGVLLFPALVFFLSRVQLIFLTRN
jgi:rod shape-determining protein MreD